MLTDAEWSILRAIHDGAGDYVALADVLGVPHTDETPWKMQIRHTISPLYHRFLIDGDIEAAAVPGEPRVFITESGRHYLREYENSCKL